jgi:2'-5' RNA ligase
VSEQYGFPFYDEPKGGSWRPRESDGLFIAIFAGVQAGAKALKVGRDVALEHGIAKSLHGANRLHVSLCCIRKSARLRSKDVFAAERAAEAVSMAPFDVQFDRVASFKSRARNGQGNPLVLLGGSAELLKLAETLVAGLRDQGLKRGVGIPHMTLLYDQQLVAEKPIPPIRWTVRDFALVHSERGLTNYILKNKWTLRG